MINLDHHWLVQLLDDKKRFKGTQILEMLATGKISKNSVSIDPESQKLMEELAFVYETAAVEGLEAFLDPKHPDENLRQQCVAGAKKTFEIRQHLPMPAKTEQCIYHILHLSSLAYCGGQQDLLQQWFLNHRDTFPHPSLEGVLWDQRLFYELYRGWEILFFGDVKDFGRVPKIIEELRNDQEIYEPIMLSNQDIELEKVFQLVSMYHWARATELVAFLILEEPSEPDAADKLHSHFKFSMQAAGRSGNIQLEMLLRWLYAASLVLIKTKRVSG